MSAWRVTIQMPSRSEGMIPPSIGGCQLTGESARSRAKTSSRSSNGRAQKSRSVTRVVVVVIAHTTRSWRPSAWSRATYVG